MTDQPLAAGATTTLPPQSGDGISPQLPPAPPPPAKAGRIIMAAAGTARITQLRWIMRARGGAARPHPVRRHRISTHAQPTHVTDRRNSS